MGVRAFAFMYGRLKRDFGFQTTFLLMLFVGKAHATAFMFYGCLNTLDGVSDGFFYCGSCGRKPAFGVCFVGRLKSNFGFQATFLLVFFVDKAHATVVFQTTFAVSAPAVRCV